MDFFRAGATFQERIFIAGNRSGKTLTGLIELVFHLTGEYPEWWVGRKFNRPIKAWCIGKTLQTTRQILQDTLLGPKHNPGIGLIPKKYIDQGRMTSKPGSPDGIENLYLPHISGGESLLTFKSSDAGADTFVGTAMDVIMLDEEPPLNVYLECLVRTMTTHGIVYITFTPDKGFSETVASFLPDGVLKTGIVDTKYIVNVTWDDLPEEHLSLEERERLISQMPPHIRLAKTKGIPYIGIGAIYPIPEEEYMVAPFELPYWWPRNFGMDVGWNATAAIWFATDPQSGVVYAYSEYMRGQAEPSIHADAIKARGDWIPGAIDPASRGRSQIDGKQVLQQYQMLGLEVYPADHSVEAGLFNVYQRLSAGKLKIFNTLQGLITEMRLYRRDEKGQVVKQNDHRCDAMRYGIHTGLNLAIKEPNEELDKSGIMSYTNKLNPITGY